MHELIRDVVGTIALVICFCFFVKGCTEVYVTETILEKRCVPAPSKTTPEVQT